MEQANLKIQLFKKALTTLQEILNEPYSEIIRDATIQRFEYTFEFCWKTLRTYLNEKHGIICNSPKSCFREGFSVDIFDAKITEVFLNMVDDRNETTHTYDEEKINEIFNNIKLSYFEAMKILYKKLRN